METASLERQIQSVQRNIAFLKKEQLDLLHDLHLEILRLQKHSTALTHDLKTKQEELSQEDGIEQQMEQKCRMMENRLADKEKTNSELRRELWHREALVVALRSDLKDKERKFLDELKRRSHRVTILNTEVQKQTEAAAYLSFQLHSNKQKLHGPRPNTKPLDRPPDKTCPGQLPTECKPKKRTHKSHSRRHAAECSFSKGMLRDSPQREMLSSCDELDSMPDPALFLHPKKHVPPHRQRSEARQHGIRQHPGFDPNDHVTDATGDASRQSKLAEDHCARSSVRNKLLEEHSARLPIKTKLTKSERETRRVLTRKNSRDSE
ncbi:coiled-coil domain-containing 92B [Lissotriton helveticus]